ncbi:hypothetical protein BGZ76_004229 [Entomortierella beljakovae]|nr:hypothetical protein BGZ76_004229 [Entomortierella beljakovae]
MSYVMYPKFIYKPAPAKGVSLITEGGTTESGAPGDQSAPEEQLPQPAIIWPEVVYTEKYVPIGEPIPKGVQVVREYVPGGHSHKLLNMMDGTEKNIRWYEKHIATKTISALISTAGETSRSVREKALQTVTGDENERKRKRESIEVAFQAEQSKSMANFWTCEKEVEESEAEYAALKKMYTRYKKFQTLVDKQTEADREQQRKKRRNSQ